MDRHHFIPFLRYPSERLVEYSYNTVGELNQVTDGTNPAAKFDYATGTLYSPLGPLAQLDLGNGVRTTLGWHKRGWMNSLLTQKVGGTTLLNLAYSYCNNGRAQQITNVLDDLKRLLTAQRGPDTSIQRKYEYDYDRYGNRWG